MLEPINKDQSNTSDNNSNNVEETLTLRQKNMIRLTGLLEKARQSGQERLAAGRENRKKRQPLKKKSQDDSIDNSLETNKESLRVAFIGGGSFGTAMANLTARNGCDVTLWVRNKRSVKQMQKTRYNKKYLPNHKLDDHLKFSHDLESAVEDKDIIFVAVPSSAFRETLQNIRPFVKGQSIVSLTKGMEKDTFSLMSDIIRRELPEVNFGVMSGPNLAVEIMDNMPSGTVIASDSEQLRHAVQTALHSAFFRVFGSDDIRGVELGGALKNIYAIAMGMASAYDVGDNTKAMLLTRALAEMSRFGEKSGANPLTFLGLSGVGDLYATCNSELSRNFRVGKMLGEGMTLEQAVKKLGQTAEGVNTIVQVHEKATKEDIYMPITHALHAVIFEDKAAFGVALNLMEVGFRSDVEFVMPNTIRSNSELSQQILDAKEQSASED